MDRLETQVSLDLLLVNPPSRALVYQGLSRFSAIEPPVWAGLIARYCLNRDFSVEILDAEAEGLDAADTAWAILSKQPRLVAFCIYGHQPSASTQCMPGAKAVLGMMDAFVNDFGAKQVPVLAIGTHPSALPTETLKEGFDYVVQGEGPITISRVLEGGSLSFVPGLWRKMGWSPPPPFNITDLDAELPNQAWELLDMKRYRAHNWHLWSGDPAGGYASVQTSLGCPFKCVFCCINAPFTVNGSAPRIRKWSPMNVATQIRILVEHYGIANIKIPDEMFCLDREHVKEICRWLIGFGLGDQLNMWAYARVDTVKDEEMLDLLRKAGFRWLGIGVESASPHVRDGVEKGRFGNEQILQAIRRVQRHGIYVAANYIFGLPDDTRESCAGTLALAKEINAEMANFYCAMAYPGSALHRMAREKGWRLPEDHGGPGWIGYSQHAYETLPLRTEALSAEEVIDIRDDAWMNYFTDKWYLERTRSVFGEKVVLEIVEMTSAGMPQRKHREVKT